MIVIVGAGLAGLAAAQKLKEAGHEDFIILEAQDYIGGRFKRMGLFWIYGGQENPIYEWLQNFMEKDSVKLTSKSPSLFMTQDGKQVPNKLINPILDITNESKRIFSAASNNLISNKPLVNHFQEALVLSTSHSCSKSLTSNEKNLKWAMEHWCELREAIENSCENFDDLSTRAYTERTFHDRLEIVCIPKARDRLVDKMVESVGLKKIFKSMPVDRVEYSSKSAVVTLVSSVKIECDHVILATPVGALQRSPRSSHSSSSIKLELDPNRQAMIDRVGFGPATWISLKFEKKFLDENLGLLWTTDPINVGFPSWTRDLLGFTVLPSQDGNFLEAWVGRSGSLEVEKWNDIDIGETCRKVLKTFLPNKEIPKPVSIRATRFSTKPYIGGANSYPSTRSDEDPHKSVWDPIYAPDQATGSDPVAKKIPRVLFAGEATAGEMCGTAHGAIMSGWREADRLLKVLPVPKKEIKREP